MRACSFMTLALAGVAVAGPVAATEVDEAAADALLRRNACFRCHAIDREKIAPAYREVAAKYKGNAEAEDILLRHVTTRPTVKVEGQDESHPVLRAPTEAAVRNVLRFILSR